MNEEEPKYINTEILMKKCKKERKTYARDAKG